VLQQLFLRTPGVLEGISQNRQSSERPSGVNAAGQVHHAGRKPARVDRGREKGRPRQVPQNTRLIRLLFALDVAKRPEGADYSA
jgi:hypothetical protein